MYVVSEVTGKRYATIEEAVADERMILAEEAKREEEEREKKMAELEKAWEELFFAMDKFVTVAEKIDPKMVVEVKPMVQLMKTLL